MFSRSFSVSGLLSISTFLQPRAQPTYYPPPNTQINNLTFALNGTGSPGIFNSSNTPDDVYGTYNWCNMPHVRSREYKPAPADFELQYVEVIHRHHKRTPYGMSLGYEYYGTSNTFFKEDVSWDCAGQGPVYYGRNTTGAGADAAVVQWQAYTDPQNPFTNLVGPGFVNSTCQFPQMTAEALEDAHVHGSDLRKVYAPLLSLSSPSPNEFRIRVTNNVITSQVAGSIMSGFFPDTASHPVDAFIQSSNFDTLEPTYSCPAADALRTGYTTGDNGGVWKDHLAEAAPLYEKLDKVSGIENPDSGGWHVSFDHYYDNLSAKQCHAKPLPCSVNATSLCVSQNDTDMVYRVGNWEYAYLFRGANDSARYSALRYGGFVLEVKGRLQGKMDGSSQLKYVHNVAHDGSISPLLGFLQIEEMVWPGMGAEVVFELYKQSSSSKYFVRILWSGQPMKTSTPLGRLDMVPIGSFFAYIDSMIGGGEDLRVACSSS